MNAGVELIGHPSLDGLTVRTRRGTGAAWASTIFFAASLFIVSSVELKAGEGKAAWNPGDQQSGKGSISSNDKTFLGEMTRDVIQASRVQPGRNVGTSPTNTCGFALIMPGGKGGYPAFWVRDFAMSLDSGFITPEEMLNHLRLVARCQNGQAARKLKNGLLIPPFSIPDHINFDGTACFYPGSYSSGEDQGNGDYGILPPADDHFEFIHIAYRLFRAIDKVSFLLEQIDGMPLFERLVKAFDCPRSNQETGLFLTDGSSRAVGFGFCDAVYLTGDILFPSLLRYHAAGELAELSDALEYRERAEAYREVRRRISKNLVATFGDSRRIGGWLIAATQTGRQPDVWGTLYALHLGLLDGQAAKLALDTITNAVRRKTMVLDAAVRHVPTDLGFSQNSAWEKTASIKVNTYQNGAYWHTPTGWLIEAVQRQDPELAAQLVREYIEHLGAQDFRRRLGPEAPWECFGQNHYAQNGVYMTSVTVPYSVLVRAARPR